MPFVPPFCPNPECTACDHPEGVWWIRRGYFRVQCRAAPEQRFRCKLCRRSFSRQTFRHDYYDKKPWTNVPLFEDLVSGVGLRQAGRKAKLDIRSVQQKLRKFAATLWPLHEHLSPALPPGRTYLLDEEESFEHSKGMPLTMPLVIEEETWFLVGVAVEPIRRRARRGSRLRRYQDEMEQRHGPRPDRSREAVWEVLQQLAKRLPEGPLTLKTDEKSSYAVLAKQCFGDRVTHLRTPGSAPRTTSNQLFPINTTIAMTRDNNGRLRKQSWLHTKVAVWLFRQMVLYIVYRNYIRRRFNRDRPDDTPAKLLGLLPRAMTAAESLRWRQVWGTRSPHPFSTSGRQPVGKPWPVVAAASA